MDFCHCHRNVLQQIDKSQKYYFVLDCIEQKTWSIKFSNEILTIKVAHFHPLRGEKRNVPSFKFHYFDMSEDIIIHYQTLMEKYPH